nr:MAG TPA: hypothetical protein [Caudoviricetes sp.]
MQKPNSNLPCSSPFASTTFPILKPWPRKYSAAWFKLNVSIMSLAFLSPLCYNRANTRDCVSICPVRSAMPGRALSLVVAQLLAQVMARAVLAIAFQRVLVFAQRVSPGQKLPFKRLIFGVAVLHHSFSFVSSFHAENASLLVELAYKLFISGPCLIFCCVIPNRKIALEQHPLFFALVRLAKLRLFAHADGLLGFRVLQHNALLDIDRIEVIKRATAHKNRIVKIVHFSSFFRPSAVHRTASSMSDAVTPYSLASVLWYFLAMPFTRFSQFDTAATVTLHFFAT